MNDDLYDNVDWNTDPLASSNPVNTFTSKTPEPKPLEKQVPVKPPQEEPRSSNQADIQTRLSNIALNPQPSFPLTTSPAKLVERDTLKITVCNPEKRGDGMKDAFTSYEVKYTVRNKNLVNQTTLPFYKNVSFSIKRRYGDFVWLYHQFQENFPTCVLPPLPDKHRLDYLDRFSTEFIERRMHSLQRFLDHVSIHPMLHRSEQLKAFLEKEYLVCSESESN
jgi:sorting nexin-4